MQASFLAHTRNLATRLARVGVPLLLAGLLLALPACGRASDGSTPPPGDETQPPGDGGQGPGTTDPNDPGTDPGTGPTDPGDGDWEPTTPRAARVVGGLTQPLGVVSAGDGRLFVVEQRGTIRIVSAGTVLPAPFLDLSGKISVEAGSEQGLLGLAFPPDYEGAGSPFYVYYTNSQGHGVLSRFQTSASDANRADPGSEEVLKTLGTAGGWHKGGQLGFGPDGYLYWALGDNKHDDSAQDLNWLSGKILRLSVSDSGGYEAPADNPYAALGEPAALVWAYGLRNPWRFSFDRETGDMYIADVGEDDYEEVNRWRPGEPAGLNYGWPCLEGNAVYAWTGGCEEKALTAPLFVYEHVPGGRRSVTGGYVYRGPNAPDLVGKYVFADFLTSWVYEASAAGGWVLHPVLELPGEMIATLGEGPNGELYVAGYASGELYEITQREP